MLMTVTQTHVFPHSVVLIPYFKTETGLKFGCLSRKNIIICPKVFSNAAGLLSTNAATYNLDVVVVGVEGQCILIRTEWQFIHSKVFTMYLLCVRCSARGLMSLMIAKGI